MRIECNVDVLGMYVVVVNELVFMAINKRRHAYSPPRCFVMVLPGLRS